jgi:hypothetical protein
MCQAQAEQQLEAKTSTMMTSKAETISSQQPAAS